MIELTSGFIHSIHKKFLINPRHIIYIAACEQPKNTSYEGVNCFVEYVGGSENQVAYVRETYEQIKGMLNDH